MALALASPFHIRSFSQTDIGLRRERNEDSYLVDEELGLFLVADGMGGHRGGEIASSLAIETLHQHIKAQQGRIRSDQSRALLIEAYRQASHKVFEKAHAESQSTEDLSGMGTTLVSAFIQGKNIWIGNVGDSRAYLWRAPHLWQLTEDHSVWNEQRRSAIKIGVARNVITRSVGFEWDVNCDVIVREVQKGDCYLLCSDGLTGMVQEPDLVSILMHEKIENVAMHCIDKAKQNGGDDNITVVVLQVTAIS